MQYFTGSILETIADMIVIPTGVHGVIVPKSIQDEMFSDLPIVNQDQWQTDVVARKFYLGNITGYYIRDGRYKGQWLTLVPIDTHMEFAHFSDALKKVFTLASELGITTIATCRLTEKFSYDLQEEMFEFYEGIYYLKDGVELYFYTEEGMNDEDADDPPKPLIVQVAEVSEPEEKDRGE